MQSSGLVRPGTVGLNGPMKLELFAAENDQGTNLRLKQSGYQHGGDWDWYYEAVKAAWPVALELLKKYLEEPPPKP